MLRLVKRSIATSSAEFDVVVIGGGPGGYVCAIRAAQLGLKTACIEKMPSLGGTCLNVGCIPSKVLLNSSHKYHEVAEENGILSRMGITSDKPKLDLHKMMSFKDRTVSGLTKGIDGLFKKYGVHKIQGEASFTGQEGTGNFGINISQSSSFSWKHTTLVSTLSTSSPTSGQAGNKITAKKVVIATGSIPNVLPFYDGKSVVTSDEAIAFESIPDRLVVVGGGIIGLELGSVWNRLGSNVTVIEHKNKLAPGTDEEISSIFQKSLIKQGIDFKFGSKLKDYNDSVLTLESGEKISCDKLLLSIGRRPLTTGLNLKSVGIDELTSSGHIPVVSKYNETKTEGIFVIGDVAPGPMLAHKAEDEGITVAHHLSGDLKFPPIDHSTVPYVVYTEPELAWVGRISGEGVATASFPFLANSRARATGSGQDGLVKISFEQKTKKLVGAQIFGPHAGDLIPTLSLAIKYGASAMDVADLSFPHPTFSEALKEACLAAHFKSIHF